MTTREPADPLLGTLGARVRSLRRSRGWTIERLARRAGLSARFLGDLEKGRGNVSVVRLARLARALGVPPAHLLSEGEDPRPVEKIVLVGLRGAGKTTIGSEAARRLGWPFVELDRRVEEAAGMPLAELFGMHGESYYRGLERRAAKQALDEPGPAVLAASGGVVTDPDAWDLLKRRARTVWLRARPRDHFRRVLEQGDHRPMAGNPRAMAELEALLARREPFYAEADVHLDTHRLGLERAIERVVRLGRTLTRQAPPPRTGT